MADEATKQGTAEYNAAYEAEMERLNAEAAGKAATTPEIKTEAPAEGTGQGKTEPNPAENNGSTESARIAQLEQQLASQTKALNDTKRYAQDANIRAKRLEQERQAERHAASKPVILADNPGLEEAIQHVAGKPSAPTGAQPEDEWATAVGTALPELDALLASNPELVAKAQALKNNLGDEWNNPYIAIRELGRMQAEHERAVVSAKAQEQARQDFERSKQKQTAMSVPGGGSSSRPSEKPTDDPARYATMTSADFAKERAKVLGYQ